MPAALKRRLERHAVEDLRPVVDPVELAGEPVASDVDIHVEAVVPDTDPTPLPRLPKNTDSCVDEPAVDVVIFEREDLDHGIQPEVPADVPDGVTADHRQRCIEFPLVTDLRGARAAASIHFGRQAYLELREVQADRTRQLEVLAPHERVLVGELVDVELIQAFDSDTDREGDVAPVDLAVELPRSVLREIEPHAADLVPAAIAKAPCAIDPEPGAIPGTEALRKVDLGTPAGFAVESYLRIGFENERAERRREGVVDQVWRPGHRLHQNALLLGRSARRKQREKERGQATTDRTAPNRARRNLRRTHGVCPR